MAEFGRRELFKIGAGAAISAETAGAAGERKFFTADEYSLVDELTEMIIPAGEKSGGAKAAKVADYIDELLAEAFEQEKRDQWRGGLKLVNSLSQEMHGGTFLQGTIAQRTAVLARMARNERQPQAPEEMFFAGLKELTIKGYYTSRIAIHDEMGYLGNTIQSGEYAGDLPSRG